MKVHYHFVREKVLQGEIEMCHVKTENQVADIFTKGLSNAKFSEFRKQLGMMSKTELRELVLRVSVERSSPPLLNFSKSSG